MKFTLSSVVHFDDFEGIRFRTTSAIDMEHLVKFIKSDFLRHSAQPGQGHLLNGLRNHWTDERGPARDSDSNGESLGESTGESKLRIKSGPEHHLGISVWLVRRFLSVAFRTWLVKHPLKIHDLLSPRWTPNGKWTSILGSQSYKGSMFWTLRK